MREPAFCICENKDADQLRNAFVFAIWILPSLYYHNPKFLASSHIMCLYSPVCVGTGRKPRSPVFLQRDSVYTTIAPVYRQLSLGQSFFFLFFVLPTLPTNFFEIRNKIKDFFFYFIFHISLRLMSVQYWSSIMFFRFVFSTAARLIKLPLVTATGEILPFQSVQ